MNMDEGMGMGIEEEEDVDRLGNTVGRQGASMDAAAAKADAQTRSSLADLPAEILIQVFGNLDPYDLDHNIGQVCTRWRDIVNNNELWKETFKNRFGTIQFASLTKGVAFRGPTGPIMEGPNSIAASIAARGNSRWRDEYIIRESLLKKWNKSTSLHKNYVLQNIIPHLSLNAAIEADFTNDRLLIFEPMLGLVNICKLSSGKYSATIPVTSSTNVLVFALTRYCLVYSILGDDKLYLKSLTTKGYLSTDITVFKDSIDPSPGLTSPNITAIAVTREMSGKDWSVGCISGDENGIIKLWDYKRAELIKSIKLPSNNTEAAKNMIIEIRSNFKDTIVALTEHSIYVIQNVNMTYMEPSSSSSFDIKHTIDRFDYETQDEDYSKIRVDYAAKQIIRWSYHKIVIYSFDINQPFSSGNVVKQYTCNSGINWIAFDQNLQNTKNNDYDCNDGSLIGVLLETGEVVVLNTRGPTQGPGQGQEMTPIRQFKPFYKNEHRGGPNQIFHTIAINSTIMILGGENGVCHLYDLLNCTPLRIASVRIPKRLLPMENRRIPVMRIILNPIEFMTNGIIICGNVVQYFQFGELESLDQMKRMKKKGYGGGSSSSSSDRKPGSEHGIKEELKDLAYEESIIQKREMLFDKYNGVDNHDEVEELELAIALSQSMDKQKEEEEEDPDLAIILELSKLEAENKSSSKNGKSKEAKIDTKENDIQDDDELAAVLELSKSDYRNRKNGWIDSSIAEGASSSSSNNGVHKNNNNNKDNEYENEYENENEQDIEDRELAEALKRSLEHI